MKIKGLLLGMFACAALVACTNDDIVENNNIEQPEKVKANLTLSISTSTGSGRAADAETGDDVENGTPSEGSIKDAVIIISPVQGNTATGLVEYADNITVTSGVYEPSFQLNQTGSYNVLVILNPCADIANKYMSMLQIILLPQEALTTHLLMLLRKVHRQEIIL